MAYQFDCAEHYGIGGFHPIYIGDTFNDRYRVVNKLGFGSYSTVWIVEDLQLNRFASMKVLSANSSAKSFELSISRHLQQQQEEGTLISVEPFYERNFDDFFPPDVTKKLAAQVALGVAYLHKCGIFHGDLHLGNVLFYSPKLQEASLKELDEIYGKLVIKPIKYWNKNDPVPSTRTILQQ
ncbi:kinase-like domain-containing protein [Cyathus striatus]|nr:kinase-like domain-containing protein [Cyathus striatus]